MRQSILLTIAFSIAGLVLAWALVEGVSKSERNDCLQWQKDAQTYPGFYLTKDEADQCTYLGIVETAPIK